MKIALVSEHASPLVAPGDEDSGGQNVHVAALADHLVRRGHEVTVYTRRDDPAAPERLRSDAGYLVEHVTAGPAERIPKDRLLPHMTAFGEHLSRAWAKWSPDIVHAHFWMSGLAAVSAEHDAPVVQTYHALGTVKRRHLGTADPSPAERLAVERYIGMAADHIIATCSDEVFELAGMGVARGKTTVVPCGIDLGHFRPGGPVAERGPRRRLVTVGRLVERKGVETIVRALAGLPDTELVVAGGPPARELDGDPQVRRLRAVAREVEVADRLVLTGAVSPADVPALLRSADVAVFTPWYEPFGIAPVEAMACGVPVVAAAVGGMIDTVVSDVTGEHVPPRDADRLATLLRDLLADPERRARYGRAGAERARTRYGWQQVAARTETVYTRLSRSDTVEVSR
jgi:glycosyltransferase involved in cell wall biosynthesis